MLIATVSPEILAVYLLPVRAQNPRSHLRATGLVKMHGKLTGVNSALSALGIIY